MSLISIKNFNRAINRFKSMSINFNRTAALVGMLPHFDRDAFMHHALHVIDTPDD